jgi:hypothetical protein
MQVVRLSHKNYLDVIESALSNGSTVLLENIGETVCTVESERKFSVSCTLPYTYPLTHSVHCLPHPVFHTSKILCHFLSDCV